MKKLYFWLIIILLFGLFLGCVQESKYESFELYGKYFDENSSSFEKVNLSSFEEAIASLDKDSNIQLIELDQEYVDAQKDKNFIRGMAYCGNKKISFGSYALRVIDSKKNIYDLNSILEIKQHFLSSLDSKKAVAFAMLELDNVDYNSIYVLKLGQEYLVKLIITPSACDCGPVEYNELWFVVKENGVIQLVKTKVLSKSYQESCIS